MYYSLLPVNDAIKIKFKDIEMIKEGKHKVIYFYQKKGFNNRFNYRIPSIQNNSAISVWLV